MAAEKLTGRPCKIGDIVGVLEVWEAAPSEVVYLGGRAMEWLMRKRLIAGNPISNWVLVLAALVAIWLIYSLAH